jgi:hypothetical protein
MLVGPAERIQRSVLVGIADSADDGTGYCWPSVRTLANKTLFSTRYVIEAVQQLERDGWVKVEHRAVKGRYTAYTVDKELLESLRSSQREQEKQRKRSGEPASPETYLSDLRKLHDAHLNRVHLSKETSHEPSSPEIRSSEVNSFASEVNSFAVSGEIHDTPNKKEKHQETSGKGEPPPCDDQSPAPAFPEGLTPMQYGDGIIERTALPKVWKLRVAMEASLPALASHEKQSLHLAAQLMEQRIRAAQLRSETVNAFWFEDSKWKLNEGATNGGNQGHSTGAVARTQRAVGAWGRAAAELRGTPAADNAVRANASALPTSGVRR